MLSGMRIRFRSSSSNGGRRPESASRQLPPEFLLRQIEALVIGAAGGSGRARVIDRVASSSPHMTSRLRLTRWPRSRTRWSTRIAAAICTRSTRSSLGQQLRSCFPPSSIHLLLLSHRIT